MTEEQATTAAVQRFRDALAGMGLELDDLATRLDEQHATMELRHRLVPAAASSHAALASDGRRMLEVRRSREPLGEVWHEPPPGPAVSCP